MYAVIKTGGKQYRVAAGEKIKVEQIAADVGQEISIEQVLAVGNGADVKIGTPWVAGASVKATVVAHGKHDKVRIFKMRRRKHYQKHGGHRQTYTEVFVAQILDGAGGSAQMAMAAAVSLAPQKKGKDDIELIEGIGPKIAKVLADNGITTFAQLAEADPESMTAMLKASGGRFSLANTASWPQQVGWRRQEVRSSSNGTEKGRRLNAKWT
jgi:large subunit ribosomal protein L21